MNKKVYPVFLLITLTVFLALFVFFTYTFLHEGGHALVGVLSGQKVTEFDVNFLSFSAHVGLVGGTMTSFQHAVQSAAGAGLPLLIWGAFIFLAPRKGSFILEALKLISSMAVINTLLPWIAIPVLFLLGKAPSDDVTNVLLYSRMPPLLLAAIALVLYAGGWVLFLNKINGLKNEFLLFRILDPEKLLAGTRAAIPVMGGLLAIGAILVVELNIQAGKNTVDKYTPPQGYSLVAQIDLTTRAYPTEPIWQFTLDEPAFAGVFIVVGDINTPYFDLGIAGPNGFHSTILHGEGYAASKDGGLWEQSLPAGTYQLVLTSQPSPGLASVYINLR